MCIEPTAEDFTTIHHELGHNFYQRAYKEQPVMFRDSANDGFHEAIGDTIALSVTPEYLVKIGLLDKAPDASRDIGLLMTRALEKIAFLPFGLLIDQWRWKVFCRRGQAGRLQQGLVGSAAEVPGHRAAVAARRGVLRSRREVPRAGQHAVHALLPGRHPAVPVPPRALEDRRLHAAAPPLLDLREQGGGTAAERHAVDGPVAAVARCARGADGRARRWTPPRSSTTSRRCPTWLDQQLAGKPVGLVTDNACSVRRSGLLPIAVRRHSSGAPGWRWPPTQRTVVAQTDLDAFMQQVLSKRDENWKKLQQYVLDENEADRAHRTEPPFDLGRSSRYTPGTSATASSCAAP